MSGYRLVKAPASASSGRVAQAPRLDEAQRRVVDHQGGPLLVLAGPGTGKTTTIVEAVTERVENRGIDPGRILLQFDSDRALTEILYVIGTYMLIARVIRTGRIPLDDQPAASPQ